MLFRIGRTDILEHIAASGFVSLPVAHGFISLAIRSAPSANRNIVNPLYLVKMERRGLFSNSTSVGGTQGLFVGNSGQGLLNQLRAIMQLLQRRADLVGLDFGAALFG